MVDFSDLISAVRDASRPSRDLDAQIYRRIFPDTGGSIPFFTDDPSAAAKLVPTRALFSVERCGDAFRASVIAGGSAIISAEHRHRFLAACLAGLMALAMAQETSSRLAA